VSEKALVLLSGGIDSVAALHWALVHRSEVRAVTYDYGQPARDAERSASMAVCARRDIPWEGFVIAEAVRGLTALGRPEPGKDGQVSRANLPARNIVLLSCAAAHAARLWPGDHVDLIIGCNADDGMFFPDCQGACIDAMSEALRESLLGVCYLSVCAPWRSMTKAQVLQWCEESPTALRDALGSVSCYGGDNCGQCDACRERAIVLRVRGHEDNAE
jgi:7-cyano-7-deazaguanine synthase